MANKTIKATLIIEDKNISVDELNDLFSGATNKIKGLSFLLRDQAHKANTLSKYLLTAIKGNQSAAIEIDEIDMPTSLPAIVKLAAKVGNKIDLDVYREPHDIFCRELEKADVVYVCTHFLGMKLFVTRMEDTKGQQKVRANKEWLENFVDINFDKNRKGLCLDVSAVFLSSQPD